MTFETDRELNYDIKTRIISDDAAFGPGVARIMTLVKETNSLSRAYESMGLSSSKGWRIIKEAEECLGFPLFLTTIGGKDGGSTKLTKEGEQLLAKYQSFVDELNKEAEKLFNKYF
ncbi:helix-turn-helix domain-containing protein [Clostridium sp. Cult3]|uniref:helix-turn-helix domain-containing protein n=1 Tax=Clostridium sp. Cult3 TaxID=2079004 RepID=UPI001F01A8D4|nr:LysR family transcriptional regulator [Clostridium sp. Cult3]MCF6460710.1 ModE family transcriptional regulator [Clostridium sp. Cult3]